jgi:hypothetical protein
VSQQQGRPANSLVCPMALREKKKHSGWLFFSGRPGQHACLTPSRRGGIYIGIILFVLWLVFGNIPNASSSSRSGIGGKLRSQALRLTNSITDVDIYGPEPPPHKQRPLPPSKSAIAPLRSWENGVPETTVHGISGGKSFITFALQLHPLASLNFVLLQAGHSWITSSL